MCGIGFSFTPLPDKATNSYCNNNKKICNWGELDEKITERLELFLDSDDKAIDEQSGLVITDIAKYWFTLINEDDAAALRTRRWYISQVMNFLKKENLINLQDETVIIPTVKFNRLAANYFLNYERLEDINRILNENTGKEESDA